MTASSGIVPDDILSTQRGCIDSRAPWSSRRLPTIWSRRRGPLRSVCDPTRETPTPLAGRGAAQLGQEAGSGRVALAAASPTRDQQSGCAASFSRGVAQLSRNQTVGGECSWATGGAVPVDRAPLLRPGARTVGHRTPPGHPAGYRAMAAQARARQDPIELGCGARLDRRAWCLAPERMVSRADLLAPTLTVSAGGGSLFKVVVPLALAVILGTAILYQPRETGPDRSALAPNTTGTTVPTTKAPTDPHDSSSPARSSKSTGSQCPRKLTQSPRAPRRRPPLKRRGAEPLSLASHLRVAIPAHW